MVRNGLGHRGKRLLRSLDGSLIPLQLAPPRNGCPPRHGLSQKTAPGLSVLFHILAPTGENFYDTILSHREPAPDAEHTAFKEGFGGRDTVALCSVPDFRCGRMLLSRVHIQLDAKGAYDPYSRDAISSVNEQDVRDGRLTPAARDCLEAFFDHTFVSIEEKGGEPRWIRMSQGAMQGYGPSCRIFRRGMQNITARWTQLEAIREEEAGDVPDPPPAGGEGSRGR